MKSALRRLLFVSATAVDVETTEKTETGNPATFTTDVKKALTQLLVPFGPVQAGTGDPTPDNVRNITGRTSITVYKSGEDTSDPVAVEFSLGSSAVYGGTVDIATGTLKVNRKVANLTGSGWQVAAGSKFYIPLTDTAFVQSDKTELSNMYKFQGYSNSGSSTVTTDKKFYLQYTTGYNRIWVYDSGYTIDTFTAMLDETPLQVTYSITPQTVQLTAKQIKTLIGENNIWTDTDGTNTVKYLVKA